MSTERALLRSHRKSCRGNRQAVRQVYADCLENGDPLADLVRGRRPISLEGHRTSVYSVAFSPNGQLLASGS